MVHKPSNDPVDGAPAFDKSLLPEDVLRCLVRGVGEPTIKTALSKKYSRASSMIAIAIHYEV